MLKAVIDTNVLVSGMHNKIGNPGKILRMIFDDDIEPIVTPGIIKEYERVINYSKFNFTLNERAEAIIFMRKAVKEGEESQAVIPGVPEDDIKFVHAVLQYDADCLITGNTKHFLAVSKVIKVMIPAEFVEFYKRTT